MDLIVTQDLPDPPYPASTKAGSFCFDVDVFRLLQSDSWAITSPEIRPWMLAGWVISWAQYPCGTWPNRDEVIAARLGCDLRFFRVNREEIMRGWVLHSDNKYYHPTITECVNSMLRRRRGWKKATRRIEEKQGDRKKLIDESERSPRGVLEDSSPSITVHNSKKKKTHKRKSPLELLEISRVHPACSVRVLTEWLEYKQESKNPYSGPRGVTAASNLLAQYPEDQQRLMVATALAGNYQGLHAPRGSAHAQGIRSREDRRNTISEEIERNARNARRVG